MQQRLYHRLAQLEAADAQLRAQSAMRDTQARMTRARNYVQLFLQVRGIEQEGNESLIETWARALGIALRDLRERGDRTKKSRRDMAQRLKEGTTRCQALIE
jgi:hypothetical protein